MEELIRKMVDEFNNKGQIVAIIAGVPIDFQKVSNQPALLQAAIHCCLNGPVSVHKLTTFPIVGETSIEALAGFKMTNGSWKSFCLKVAEILPRDLKCNTSNKLGAYWPIKDWQNTKI